MQKDPRRQGTRGFEGFARLRANSGEPETAHWDPLSRAGLSILHHCSGNRNTTKPCVWHCRSKRGRICLTPRSLNNIGLCNYKLAASRGRAGVLEGHQAPALTMARPENLSLVYAKQDRWAWPSPCEKALQLKPGDSGIALPLGSLSAPRGGRPRWRKVDDGAFALADRGSKLESRAAAPERPSTSCRQPPRTLHVNRAAAGAGP